MILGAQYWETSDYYSQENNPTEAYNKARLNDRSYWLESCGPTSAINCMAAMGFDLTIKCPGEYKPQPEEVLMDFMNDPRNAELLQGVRDMGDYVVPENQVPQYYPISVSHVFGVWADFKWGAQPDVLMNHLMASRAVQVCLKRGHYIALIAYDADRDEFIYNDPWGSYYADGKGGKHRRLTRDEIAADLQPYRIVYGL